MGKGDRKSRRGKIWRGSYGKTRPHHVNKDTPPEATEKPTKKATKKRAPRKKKEE